MMNHIYVNQTALEIILKTATSLREADSVEIRYSKPDRCCGSFNAEISDREQGTICHFVSKPEELDMPGWWNLWSYVRFSDGRCAPGRAVRIYVYPEGE